MSYIPFIQKNIQKYKDFITNIKKISKDENEKLKNQIYTIQKDIDNINYIIEKEKEKKIIDNQDNNN